MFHYKLSDRQVLRMPIRRFWFLHHQINSFLAELDSRQLRVAAVSQSADGVKEVQEQLTLEIGEWIKYDEAALQLNAKRDEEGFAALRNIQFQ